MTPHLPDRRGEAVVKKRQKPYRITLTSNARQPRIFLGNLANRSGPARSMFVIIGIVVVLGCTMLGYMMHGGNIGVLIQINELVILAGAGFGSFLAANGMKNVQA